MRRRYKALIAIIVPTIIVATLKKFYPIAYEVLFGYMLAVAIIFKASIISLWLTSKVKLIAFLKSLTLFQAILLAIKRWFLDNIFAKWLKKYVIKHFIEPIESLIGYYKNISLKAKIKNFLLIFLPISIAIWILYITDTLSSLAIYAEIKLIIIGFFKSLWLLLGKIFSIIPTIFSYLGSSWFSPILEVFALSFIIDFLEKKLGKDNFISRFFNYINIKLDNFLNYIGLINEKHIDRFFKTKVEKPSKKLATFFTKLIDNKKIATERLYFDNLKNIILNKHINAYYSFKNMHKIKDKKELYSLINKKTDDNIDIIGFVSRDKFGNLVNEDFNNDFYHDIFILKGVASHPKFGVKKELKDGIDYSDFWILNTSKYPVEINAKGIKRVKLKGNDLELIKARRELNLQKELFFKYKNKITNPIML